MDADSAPEALLDLFFQRARSEISYVLDVARAHRGVSASGSLHGDNVWLRVGAATLRFVYSRRARVLVASVPGRADEQLRFRAEDRVLTGNDGRKVDMQAYLETALETTMRAWKAGPMSERVSERSPMPTLPTLTDESEQATTAPRGKP